MQTDGISTDQGVEAGSLGSRFAMLPESAVGSVKWTEYLAPSFRSLPRIGKVIGIAPSGLPLLHFKGNPEAEALPARHVCPIRSADVGREAVLIFEDNDPCKPIVLGLLQPTPGGATHLSETPDVNPRLDGEQITLTAEKEIVLQCGKASITLTRAGKVLIRGAYLLSRSSGVNQVQGGSVLIN